MWYSLDVVQKTTVLLVFVTYANEFSLGKGCTSTPWLPSHYAYLAHRERPSSRQLRTILVTLRTNGGCLTLSRIYISNGRILSALKLFSRKPSTAILSGESLLRFADVAMAIEDQPY